MQNRNRVRETEAKGMVTRRERAEGGWEGEGDTVNPTVMSSSAGRQGLESVGGHSVASKY